MQVLTSHLHLQATTSLFQSAFKVKAMIAVAAVATDAGATADIANRVEANWSKLKDPLLDAAIGIFSPSKDHQWILET